MFKVMWLMKRKQGTEMRELIDYYENHHSRLAAKLFEENDFKPVKYIRRYLHAMIDPIPEVQGSADEPKYDVAMEMWFNSRSDFDSMVEFSSPEAINNMIVVDERRFLDRDQRAVFILEEHETTFD